MRQTWLQDVPEGADVSHIFVVGEDKSFTQEENAKLAEEVKNHKDILVARAEESSVTVSEKTKECIYWVTKNHDFDILIKTKDDSTVFLSRVVGARGILSQVKRDDFVYFGKKHPLLKVSNPANFDAKEPVDTFTDFEFDYRGVYWPDYMEGGMYGFSRRLVEEIVKNDFRTYTVEDAMVGVWVSGLHAEILYLSDDQVLHDAADYHKKNGTRVVVSFETDCFRLASMWCDYTARGTLSADAMRADDVERALACLGSYQRAALVTRSKPLGASRRHQEVTLRALEKKWPIQAPPDPDQTGQWWARMAGVFRKRPAVVIGNGAAVDRLPLYQLHGIHSLVFDDFFRVADRYTRTKWAPTMYMCVDPSLCASDQAKEASIGARGGRGGREPTSNLEGVNRFARSVFAAFYIMNKVDGAEYWRYLRQRATSHWYVAGSGKCDSENSADQADDSEVGQDVLDRNFVTSSRRSGVAMGIEVLGYLGFSPVYVTGAQEEIDEHWEEVKVAIERVGSTHGTEVVYLFADESDTLDQAKALSLREKGLRWNTQEPFEEATRLLLGSKAARSRNWDLHVLLENFPVTRLEIVPDASSVEAMFPKSPKCRDAEDLDRFQKAVLCPVNISMKHFSSFLAWHVPYGPVRGLFVWAKR